MLHICALVPSWDLRELLYAALYMFFDLWLGLVLYMSAITFAQICSKGLRRVVLCCAAHLCCIIPLVGLEELLYPVLQICAVISALTSLLGLRELHYAVLQICAVICAHICRRQGLRKDVYTVLHICAVISAQI